MKKKLYSRIILPIMLSLLFLSGCWDRKEINGLGIVTAVGIDKGPGTNQIKLTAQVYQPTPAKQGESALAINPYKNLVNTGNSVFGIIRSASHQTGRKLFFSHCDVLIFGSSLAGEGIQKYLDFFLRDQESYLKIWVLVAEGEAIRILNSAPFMEKIPSSNINKILQNQAANSETSVVRLDEFIERLLSQSSAAIMPIIDLEGQDQEQNISISGTAVFKQDKMAGRLNRTETRGLLWVLNKVKGGLINVTLPGSNQELNMQITGSSSKYSLTLINSKINVKIKIRVTTNIGEQTSPEKNLDWETVELIKQAQEKAIQNEITAAFAKAKTLKADVFGFGDRVYQKYPQEWKKLKPKWDEVFPEISLSFDIESKILGTGRIDQTVSP